MKYLLVAKIAKNGICQSVVSETTVPMAYERCVSYK